MVQTAQHTSVGSDRETLGRALRRWLPDEAVLDQPEQLRPYECDGFSAYRRLPLGVVLPETTEQVQAVMRYCAGQGIPVMPTMVSANTNAAILMIAEKAAQLIPDA
ncbi:MAG TPA: hypothetical protein DG414_03505 [Gammaproteobacteria bacterium]|jgi:glycolate oxidase|nr:hypothetical protein [Arenicellales bacterium]MDP6854060.1 hypothetical protein [Arenicellales bacterium]MDP6947469.1 hypothetical protein [Arenicellales bacterium]HCY12885.1 hypothetical protein [Gammaproteobacteria bacterium]|tara:strand:+ start:6163 stop:6480 length:318 start_codon:yes stop_codon:yes gene_type:complete